MKRICLNILAFFALLIATTSCEHKDLCVAHYATLRIEFNWQYAPDANPQSMRVYLYRDGGTSFYRIADFDRNGGYIRDVAPGTYHLICFNNTETAYERDTQSFSAENLITSTTNVLEPIAVVTSQDVPVAAGTEDEEVRRDTETIWGCSQVDIYVSGDGTYHEIFVDGVDYSNYNFTTTEQVITLYPKELTCLYTVEIRHVENLSSVYLMSASLSGLAQNLNLATGEPDGSSVIVPFALEKADDTTITAEFVNFGTTEVDPNQLVLYVWTNDGAGYAFGINDTDILNVTDQVRSAEDRHRVHIIIDGFTMPTSQSSAGGAGFDARVDDWPVEYQNISI